MTAASSIPAMLIVEPQFVLRRAVVAVAKAMAAANFSEAADVSRASAMLRTQRFDAIVLDVDSGPPALELLSRLRLGETACDANVQIICTHSGALHELADQLDSFRVHELLRKPFKIGELLASMRRA